MIDILTVKKGDLVEYGPYICSESLKDNRYLGIYQDFMFWSPDERPVELWVNLIAVDSGSHDHRPSGAEIFTRASQVTNVFPSADLSMESEG